MEADAAQTLSPNAAANAAKNKTGFFIINPPTMIFPDKPCNRQETWRTAHIRHSISMTVPKKKKWCKPHREMFFQKSLFKIQHKSEKCTEYSSYSAHFSPLPLILLLLLLFLLPVNSFFLQHRIADHRCTIQIFTVHVNCSDLMPGIRRIVINSLLCIPA